MNHLITFGKNFFIAFVFLLGLSLLSLSCKKHNDDNNDRSYDVLYLQTNDFNDNANAILAYRDNGEGKLEPLAGSPFLTKGSGVGNPMQILGPLDSDYELRLSTDGQFLLTVNSGSNTIAVFSIKSNGTLEHVTGSPFPSGGQTPVSIDVSGNIVYVVNKSQDPLHEPTMAPNYSAFTIDGLGKLTPVVNGKFETTPGSSPTQVLVSRDKKFVFGVDFLGFTLMPPVGTLRSFTTSETGILNPVTGTPYVLPAGPMPPDNGALGLWQHPSGNPLYVGLPLQGMVGIFDINPATGGLTLQSTVPAGKAACWIRTNASGNHMYVLNSGENTITVYNSVNATAPLLIQKLTLKQTGPLYTVPGLGEFATSEPFSPAFSTDEKFLYIVNQHTNKDFSIGNYNFLHVLKIEENGGLTEESEPIQLPVPNTVRPKGSLVYRGS